MSRQQSIILMFAASFCWATGFIAMSVILESVNAVTLLFFRYLIVIAVLIPIILKTEGFDFPSRKNILYITGMAVFNVLLMNLLMFEAYRTTTGINIAVISAMNPLTIAFWSAALLKVRFRWIQVIGALLAFFGVLVMVFKGNLYALRTLQFHPGDLWMMVAVFSFGLSAVCSRYATRTISPLNALFYSAIIGLVLLLPIGFQSFEWPDWDINLLSLVLLVGVVSTALAQWFFNVGIKHIGAAESGFIINFNPVFATLISFVFLHEMPVWGQLIGWLTIMAGTALFYNMPKSTLK
ncbi:DMT family transporter [Parapedobacter koreensis]|uniref:EamA-like transporter family protein n=1 Tax=Parapedobacter koreensis TaxID=332977 RepID=A0A1H7LRF5_9SPHI|nr:DMT family transporter [Parapedobacter koreensis]SEL01521.1 EamA-like transporter family protein [Parapedobacter koreensis]